MTQPPRTAEAPSRARRVAIRGASEATLDRPAGLYLASLRWGGPAPDPDTLRAGDFLARL